MIGENKLKQLAKLALGEADRLKATQAEAVLWNGVEELTRFAENQIHQSVSLEDAIVHIRFILGKKIGVARSNRLDKEGILAVVKKAQQLAKIQKEDEHFKSLPDKSDYEDVSYHYKEAKHMGAINRAKAVGHIIALAQQSKLTASGAFAESDGETLVANSNGVLAYHKAKSSSLTTIMSGDKGSGYAGQSAKGGMEIDAGKVADAALVKATFGDLREIPAGEYEVILEPPAVAELMDFFSWLGPNARIYHEDVSFYQGNIGKKLLSESLTIVDDPLDPGGYPISFDFEGHPKKGVTLVENGVIKDVVYDSYHAHKHGAENTGHAQLAPNTWGPIPTHVKITAGDQKLEDMIKSVKKGLLVTRFWYTRVIHHKQLMLTGMTRDGTFVIENGKIVGRVRNLRYTESVLTAFKDIRGVGEKLSLEGSEGSPSLVPALHLGKFRFTGVTEHG